MTPLELCEKLGGYANINKLIVVHNGKQKYLATMVNGEYEFTDFGKTVAAEANAKRAVGLGDEPKKKRRAKKKTAKKVDFELDESKIEVTTPEEDVDSSDESV